MCNNESIITYYYIGYFHSLPIITIITLYYVFETGHLVDGIGRRLRLGPCGKAEGSAGTH